jgi:hypothetical protein
MVIAVTRAANYLSERYRLGHLLASGITDQLATIRL